MEKYSSLISDWEIFKNDLYSDLDGNIVCTAPIKKVFINLINYVGCKTVMGHLLFCNRLICDKNQCNHCTMMICFDQGHGKTLSKLNSMPISSLLVYAPQRAINTFKMSLPDIENSIISLNSVIGGSSLNNSMIKDAEIIFLRYQSFFR